RRGLNRATWSMRLPPPKVPPAAAGGFGAATGPRVLPGNYTVRLTKESDSLKATLALDSDPRAKHSVADRKAQFDLAMTAYRQLGEMTDAVERINTVRLALDDRAGRLSLGDPLTDRLRTA